MKTILIGFLTLILTSSAFSMGSPPPKKKKKRKKRRSVPYHNQHVTQSKPSDQKSPAPTPVVVTPETSTEEKSEPEMNYQSDIKISEVYAWIKNQSSIPKKWSIQVKVKNTGDNPIKLTEGGTLFSVKVLKGKNLFLEPVTMDYEKIIPAGESAVFQIPFGFGWSIIQKPRKYKLKLKFDPNNQFQDTNPKNNEYILKGKIFG